MPTLRLALLCLLITPVYAQNTGSITGLVTSGDRPLGSASVTITATGQVAVTDSQGRYTLLGVEAGSVKLEVSHWAHEPKKADVTVKAGVNTVDTISLTLLTTVTEEIMVEGSLREGQAKALVQQRYAANAKSIVAADQIGSFPDSNAAEATSRVPGVNIARDQGEGRYIQVRGTEARLNRTTINGLDLPAPEGDLRTVALDVIPLDMVEAIEVSKAITPDMDGDAIGGAVNMRLKSAPRQQRISVGLEYGQTELSGDDITGGDFYFGRRFMDDKLGMTLTFSNEDVTRGTDNFEVAYDDNLPEELELRDYEVERKRTGATFSLDFEPNASTRYTFDYSYAQFDDQEFRRRVTYVIPDGEVERELKDRFETQQITTAKFGGEFLTGNGGMWDFSVSHAYAHENEPGRRDSTFKAEDIEFNPNWTSTADFQPFNIQPNPVNDRNDAYEFDDLTLEENRTNDEHNAVQVNYQWPSTLGKSFTQFKVGGKFRTKEKTRDVNVTELKSSGDLSFTPYIDNTYNENSFLDGQYPTGSFHGRNQVNDFLPLLDESEFDFEEDAADYDVSEDLFAVYGMATIELNPYWTFIPGIRFESVSADYTGKEILFNDDGDYVATTAVNGGKDDDVILPMFHFTNRFRDSEQIRLSLTRTYARARVFDQVPYRFINEEDSEIETGNPDIELTLATNFDVSYENYLDDVGLFSFSFFWKDLDDYIYIFNTDQTINGEDFEVTTPLNGDSAELYGAEIAFQRNFTMLPAPFDGLGLYANYTLTDSRAKLDGRTINLPGQADRTGNLSLIYEKGGFSMRLSGNLAGTYIDEVGDEPAEDVIVDERFQWDLTASYRVNRLRFFAEIINLNDEKYVVLEGDATRPIQYEQYQSWGRIGIKYDF